MNNGYNLACQHNLDIPASPGLSCYVKYFDIWIITATSSINPVYGQYQNILITGKNGLVKFYVNGVFLPEQSISGVINPTNLTNTGFGICSRSSWGHTFYGIIDKVLVTSTWYDIDTDIIQLYNTLATN